MAISWMYPGYAGTNWIKAAQYREDWKKNWAANEKDFILNQD